MSSTTKIKFLGFYISIFLLFQINQAEATTTCEVFKKYRKEVFIETGSYRGDGIRNALEAGFSEIHSIEIAPKYYNFCKERFKNNPKVHLYFENSIDVLPKILSTLTKPATFWLDGHYSWGDTGRGDTNTPLLKELEIIAQHSIKTHVILIDDIRQLGTIEFDFINLEDITKLLMSINSNYKISYEDGYIKNDVLVAQ